MWKEYFSFLNKKSTAVLSIAGLIGLIYAIFNYPSTAIDSIFENALSFDAVAKPTCEQLPLLSLRYHDGTHANAMLIGLTIRTTNGVNDLSFRFRDIAYIHRWAISTDSLSQSNTEEILKSLPTGVINAPFVLGNIPKLIGNSETIIQFEGLTKKGFDCSAEWFDLSSPTRKIALLEIDNQLPIRGTKFGISGDGNSFYKLLSFALIIVLLFLIPRNFVNSASKKERFRVRPK